MYSILLHVSGIAILEICFYFYYIGPMETVIFTHKVLDMVDTQKYDLILPEPVYIPYNQTVYEYFKEENEIAFQEREAKNGALFRKALSYWYILVSSGILSYGIFMAYKVYKTHTQLATVMDRESDEDLELIQLPLYRKGSMDSQDMEIQESPRCSNKCKKYINKAIYYVLCGGCILGFQYAFFQYIVFHYDPLSTAEVEFIVYDSMSQHVKHGASVYSLSKTI